MTMLVVDGDHLYVGFDNEVDGIRIYRTGAAQATSRADFEGEGCTAASAGCAGLGGDGFGDPATNAQIDDAVVALLRRSELPVRGGGQRIAPVRIYRHRD